MRRMIAMAAWACLLGVSLPAAAEIEKIEHLGQLVRECALPGETRRDDVVPRHANAIQLSAARWLLLYSTHGYRGVDDERSVIYQVRRDAPDGPVLKEGFVARGQTDWKPPGAPPLPGGQVYYKQHGHPVAFGVPRGALVGGRPAPHANVFVVKWRVAARALDVKADFLPYEKVDKSIGVGIEWMQCRLNDRGDDLEVLRPAGPMRQKGFEAGDAMSEHDVKRMTQGFCPPVAANADFTEWADCNHVEGGRAVVLRYRFDAKSGLYDWAQTGPPLGEDPKRTLGEPSLLHMPGGEWVVALRGRGETVWARAADPFAGPWSPLVATQDPPATAPLTAYRCPDGVVRLFTNDSRTVPTRHIRDPLFCWDVDADRGFAVAGRREVFSVAAGKLPIRPQAHAKIDFPQLFPPQGRTQLLAHGVSTRAMNHPTEGWPDMPLQDAAEKDACGLYYARITYRDEPPAAWAFEK